MNDKDVERVTAFLSRRLKIDVHNDTTIEYARSFAINHPDSLVILLDSLCVSKKRLAKNAEEGDYNPIKKYRVTDVIT